MKKYKVAEISEKELEEMVRNGADLIEEGLKYIDHQKRTERGPLDVLFADSGNALVVAELKVTEDEGMLVQGLDYYDYIASNIEGFARAYRERKIDPTQKPRLFLIAPSFSVSLLNRCKWIDISLSLFTFQCLVFEDNPKEIVPVFKEITIPPRLQPVEVYTTDQKLNYITDDNVRKIAEELLKEIQSWDKDNILIEAIKYSISIKVSGRVFMYLDPRRKRFLVSTWDDEDKWSSFPIQQPDDLSQELRNLLKGNYEYFK
jgi:hypothetical protein